MILFALTFALTATPLRLRRVVLRRMIGKVMGVKLRFFPLLLWCSSAALPCWSLNPAPQCVFFVCAALRMCCVTGINVCILWCDRLVCSKWSNVLHSHVRRSDECIFQLLPCASLMNTILQMKLPASQNSLTLSLVQCCFWDPSASVLREICSMGVSYLFCMRVFGLFWKCVVLKSTVYAFKHFHHSFKGMFFLLTFFWVFLACKM